MTPAAQAQEATAQEALAQEATAASYWMYTRQ